MSDTIIVGLFSLCGTVVGTVGGIIASSKLTVYRIKQLENKVDKHNNFAQRIPLIEEKVKVINHRLNDLEMINNEIYSKHN